MNQAHSYNKSPRNNTLRGPKIPKNNVKMLKNQNTKILDYFQLLPFTFSGGFRLFLSSDAGLFIVFMLTDFAHNARTLTGPFKPTQSTVKGFILANFDLAHCFPSPRNQQTMQLKTCRITSSKLCQLQNAVFSQNGFPQNRPTKQRFWAINFAGKTSPKILYNFLRG